MDDLRRYKEIHGNTNVSGSEYKSLAKFCVDARCTLETGKGMEMSDERIAALTEIGFDWTSQEDVKVRGKYRHSMIERMN
jgi:hypothetical protein